MSGVMVLFGLILWLVLGGWALVAITLRSDFPRDRQALGVMLVLCLLFGPFVFGIALALGKLDKSEPDGWDE